MHTMKPNMALLFNKNQVKMILWAVKDKFHSINLIGK